MELGVRRTDLIGYENDLGYIVVDIEEMNHWSNDYKPLQGIASLALIT